MQQKMKNNQPFIEISSLKPPSRGSSGVCREQKGHISISQSVCDSSDQRSKINKQSQDRDDWMWNSKSFMLEKVRCATLIYKSRKGAEKQW